MAYSRTDILRAIDRSLYASRRASDNPALEEELARRERNLKSEQALDLLEFLLNLDPAEEWNRILEQASHYPIETLGLSQRSYHGLVTYGIYHIRTVADLLRLSLADLRKLRNLGDKSIAEIAQAKDKFLEELRRKGTRWGVARLCAVASWPGNYHVLNSQKNY